MKLIDLLAFSLQSFKNRRSRMILTVLGVAIAIGVILFLVSLGYGLQKTILERITTEDSLLTLDVYPPEAETIKLNTESIQTIKDVETVKVVSPQAVISANASYDQLRSEVSVNAVNPDYFKLAGLDVLSGELLVDSKSNRAVVSPVVAELFAVSTDELLDKKITLTFEVEEKMDEIVVATTSGTITPKTITVEKEFVIAGVLDTADETPAVFVKLSDVSSLMIDEYQFVKVQVKQQGSLEEVRTLLIEKGFIVSALSDVVEQANQIFGIIQIVLAVFGIFSLFVAAIGLINTMTISLLERINEIGIMRAIGASAWDIRKIFLIESTMIGFFGGVTGIVIGLIGGWLFNLGLNILANTLGAEAVSIFHTPLWFIFFIVIFSAVVGFVAGILPAQKAGKLNALEALRYK